MRTLTLLLLLSSSAAPAMAQHAGHDSASAGLASLDPATRAAAQRQIDQVARAVARYRDHEAAEAGGYRRFEPGAGDPLMGEHWYLPRRVPEPLDLTRPSTLIYAPIDGERRLVAVAYTTYQRPGEPLPEGFAGDADRWHVHGVAGLARIALSDRPVLRWIAENRLRRGVAARRAGASELVMLHAWIGIENPDGVFANHNPALPYARAGLPTSWATAGGEEAARGVALLAPGACDEQVRGLERLAGLDDRQTEDVRASCRRAAAAVADARDRATRAGSPAVLNDAAAAAWRDHAASVVATLSREQEQRLAALRAATRH